MELEGISACIPARNEEKTIEKAVQSVLNQKYSGNIEVVVCANACTDLTESIVSRLSDQDSRVRLIASEPGKPNAWNKLIEASKYSLVAFADADVIVHPNAFYYLQSEIRSNANYVAAIGNHVRIMDGLDPFSKILNLPVEIPGFVSVSGALYMIDKNKFLKHMNEKGYEKMPHNIIHEDSWISMLLKDSAFSVFPNSCTGYTKYSKVYYRPSSFNDICKLQKRKALGSLQLTREHPNLGVCVEIGNSFSWQKLKRWYDKWNKLELSFEKLIVPFSFAANKILEKGVALYTNLNAANDYKQGRVTNLWEPILSSKKPIEINF